MTLGFPPSELTSITAIPGATASAEPTDRKGSMRNSEPGIALTATLDVRMLVPDRCGVTTTVSSSGIRAVSGRSCALTVEHTNRERRAARHRRDMPGKLRAEELQTEDDQLHRTALGAHSVPLTASSWYSSVCSCLSLVHDDEIKSRRSLFVAQAVLLAQYRLIRFVVADLRP